MDTVTSSSQARSAGVVAAFDFDGTLTRCDSLLPFLRFMSGRTRFLLKMAALSPTFAAFAVRLISNSETKERALTRFLGGLSEDEVHALGRQFAKDHLPKLLNPRAMERLQWHQEQGHTVLLVSASLDIYLNPWAEANGFDGVLCTTLDIQDGMVTGRLGGPNCYGPEKVRRLEAHLGDLSVYELYAYGDSGGDREMLARADHSHYRVFAARRRGLRWALTLSRGMWEKPANKKP